jgi:hypothetical protein
VGELIDLNEYRARKSSQKREVGSKKMEESEIIKSRAAHNERVLQSYKIKSATPPPPPPKREPDFNLEDTPTPSR